MEVRVLHEDDRLGSGISLPRRAVFGSRSVRRSLPLRHDRQVDGPMDVARHANGNVVLTDLANRFRKIDLAAIELLTDELAELLGDIAGGNRTVQAPLLTDTGVQ